MNPDKQPSIDKWQQLAAIVNQQALAFNPHAGRQFTIMVFSRALTENSVIFLLQYTGLMMSTLLAHPSFLWLASGTASAYVFMRGPSVLPGIWLGCFLAYFYAGVGFIPAALCALVLSLQALALLWLSYRYISPTLIFYRPWPFVKFIIITLILTAISTLLLDLLCYSQPPADWTPLQLWQQGWLANFNGIVLISCAIVTWDMYFPQVHSLRQLSKIKLGFLYGLLFIIILAFLTSHTLPNIILFAITTLPLILLISTSLGWCGTVAAAFILGISLSLGAYLEAPLFALSLSPKTFLFLQYLFGIEITLGVFAALTS